ncbi:ribonuclease H-like domain-containing protein [Tanacetum coccineum]
MTGNMSNLSDYEEIDSGFVAFGRDPKGGKITSKGKITTGIENLIDLKVKVIRCDIGTEFKNKVMNQFCEMKGIKREFSFARTPQQNGVAERKNRTLIEAARIMLADSKLLTTFWTEAVNTACYVQNRVLVIKPHNKTPYELFLGSLYGNSTNSKAFRVFNSRTRIVEENLHVKFSEETPNIVGNRPNWLFDIDALTKSMNYEPVVAGNQSNGIVEDDEGVGAEADMNNLDTFMPIEKEVYVYQPPGFKDPKFSDRVYKVEKALYGLHQAPRAWYETLSTYLLNNGYQRDSKYTYETSKPLLKDVEAKDVDVHLYRSMIGSLMYLKSSRPDIMFVVCACARFQVTPKVSHLLVVKRIFRYLKG